MIKKIPYLIIAVLGNAIGTALMVNTDIGLTAWGSAAFNVGAFLDVSFGTAFIILALVFYLIALILQKSFKPVDTLLSLAFLVSFGMLSDLFIVWFPSFAEVALPIRILINFFGLSILIFAIAVHLKILIAVHPCDVFLYQMQVKLKSDLLGTYLTYGIAFLIAIGFGLLSGKIAGIGIGTLMTVTLSGLLIKLYNRTILRRLDFGHNISSQKEVNPETSPIPD